MLQGLLQSFHGPTFHRYRLIDSASNILSSFMPGWKTTIWLIGNHGYIEDINLVLLKWAERTYLHLIYFYVCSSDYIVIVYWIWIPIDFIAHNTYTFFFSIRNIVYTTHVSWQSFWWICVFAVDFTESLTIPTVSRALNRLKLGSIKFVYFQPNLLKMLIIVKWSIIPIGLF